MSKNAPVSLRKDTYRALQQFDLLDFTIKLAAATGAFEAVAVEVPSSERDWKILTGYQVAKKQARIISTRPVSMINKKKAFIVETNQGEFWATPEQINARFFYYHQYQPAMALHNITRIIPSTGY